MYCAYILTVGAPTPSDNDSISAGDCCAVELDPDMFKLALQSHGGWEDEMAEVKI